MTTKLAMPDTGQLVDQGGPEDRATWWTCGYCGFRGPHVGEQPDGQRRCIGSCGVNVKPNPSVPRMPDGPPTVWQHLKRDTDQS